LPPAALTSTSPRGLLAALGERSLEANSQ